MKVRFWFFLTTIAVTAATISIVFPAQAPLALSIASVAALGYVLTELNASARRLVLEEESEFDRVLQTSKVEPMVPEDLKRARRAMGWGSYEPGYFDFRVRPILRELIHYKVHENLHIDLITGFDEARNVVHPELLNLFGDARAERLYKGNIQTIDLERMVTLIEDV
jgi:hypothetical protein